MSNLGIRIKWLSSNELWRSDTVPSALAGWHLLRGLWYTPSSRGFWRIAFTNFSTSTCMRSGLRGINW